MKQKRMITVTHIIIILFSMLYLYMWKNNNLFMLFVQNFKSIYCLGIYIYISNRGVMSIKILYF